MSKTVVRRLDFADVAAYRAIRLAALAGAPDAFGSTLAAKAARPDPDLAERLKTSLVFASERDGTVVGMAGFKQEDGEKRRHKGIIWGVYVAHEARGSGAGTALIETLLSAADEIVEQVTLVVVRTNAPALALYRKFGFETYGIERRALKRGDRYDDELLMVRFRRDIGLG